MGDDEDRKFLESLPELEREQILHSRHEKKMDIQRKKELLDRMNRERGEMLNRASKPVIKF